MNKLPDFIQKYLFLFIPVHSYLFVFRIMQNCLFGPPQISYISVMLSTEEGMAPGSEKVDTGTKLFSSFLSAG